MSIFVQKGRKIIIRGVSLGTLSVAVVAQKQKMDGSDSGMKASGERE